MLRYTGLQEQLNRVRMSVSQARLALEGDQKRLIERRAELRARIQVAQSQAAILAEAQKVLAELALKAERRNALASELRTVSDRSTALRVENERVRVEGQSLLDKMTMLGEKETAACPLCGQPLTPAHRDEMVATLKVEHKALQNRFQTNLAEMKALAANKSALETEDASSIASCACVSAASVRQPRPKQPWPTARRPRRKSCG